MTQETLTPERQAMAAQVATVFNSLHQFLSSLELKDADGRAQFTRQLEFAHARIDEASFWAVKHVLMYGTPPRPAAPAPAHPAKDAPTNDATPPAANEDAPLPQSVPETPTEPM